MQETYQDSIEELSKCTVAIQETGNNGRILGTGVIVTNDGLILTCYHVVRTTNNKILDKKNFNVYFANTKDVKPAELIENYSNSSLDIAFLQLQEKKLPEQARVAPLSESIYFGHEFASIGFRKPETFDSLTSKGEIRRITTAKQKANLEDPTKPMLQICSDEIEPGMSGAPVLDLETNKVVGIISQHWVASGKIDSKLNFAIPVSSIIENSQSAVPSILREKNPALNPFNRFLEQTRLNKSGLFQNFNEVYIPPKEYPEIEKNLDSTKGVLIIGTAEYGKTFTAIRLLWEYCKRGYTPKYIQDRSEEVIKKIYIQDEDLRHNIIYLEDPVGQVEYNPNNIFKDYIGRITVNHLDNMDLYLLITMREEIYEKFEPIGKQHLKKFVKTLNISNDSYDATKRKEMLLKWATVNKCKWLDVHELKNFVLHALENKEILPTPLNINDFATDSINIVNKKGLQNLLYEKSQRTPERFAKEVENMTEDKQLFVSLPFISDSISVGLSQAKTIYKRLAKKLGIQIDEQTFDTILHTFQDHNKISIRNTCIRFSHPSYYQALPYLLVKDGTFTKFNLKIFSKALLNFGTSDLKTVSRNFDKLPEDIRNKILEDFVFRNDRRMKLRIFFESDLKRILYIIRSNYDKLPEDLVANLFVRMVKNDWIISDLYYAMIEGFAYSVVKEFHKLPEDRRNELSSLNVPNPICLITNGVPSNSERNNENRISNIILSNFNNKIPERSKSVILENFRKLPEDIRRYLGKYHKRLPKEFGLIKPIKTCHVCGHSKTSHRSKEGERWCSECNYYCHSPY